MSGPMSIGYIYEENKKIIGVMCGRQSTYYKKNNFNVKESLIFMYLDF